MEKVFFLFVGVNRFTSGKRNGRSKSNSQLRLERKEKDRRRKRKTYHGEKANFSCCKQTINAPIPLDAY